MFSFVCTRAQSARPCLRPWTRTPFLPSHAFFSSTRPTAITRVQRERESQEARAARLARQRQYDKTRLANETGQEREARLVRQRQRRQTYRANESDDQREARLAEERRHNEVRRANETPEAKAARLAKLRQINKVRRANQTDQARQARLAQNRQYQKARRANETDEQRQTRLDHDRQFRANSPERHRAYLRKFRRIPENREKAKQANRDYFRAHPREGNPQHEQLSIRRANALVTHVFLGKSKRIVDTYTWKTHTPVSFDDKVEHHCTACHKFRFLKYWWKEISRSETAETSSHHDRYMCSRCFASDWNLLVPETYSGRLPKLFTSPDYPPPYLKERLKAMTLAQQVKKEHEENQKAERP